VAIRIMFPIIVTVSDMLIKFDFSRFFLTYICDKPKDKAEIKAKAIPNMTFSKLNGNY